MKKGIIIVDPKRCVACRTCELQCAVAHSKSKDLNKAIYEEPRSKSRVKVESCQDLVVPLQCRHCEDAPCVKICPTKALEKFEVEGPVLIDDKRCIGCKWCVVVCPFGVINMDKSGKAIIKCDLCFERLKNGERPVCCAACPTGALQFKTMEEVTREKKREYLVKFNSSAELPGL
ncbi:MAG: 4Fe-4S dicluster domain-containing protein [Candidatus Omnitrophota bacterium]